LPIISNFDPWRSSLCTCPSKLTFNPYTGCDHNCIYCYATSYIPNFRNCKPKNNLLARLKREAAKLNGEVLAMSNSSDPYPNAESKLGLTRQCLKILAENNVRLQIFTKSSLVTRDIDLLSKIPCTVAFTITTLDESLACVLEPKAPAPSERLRAIKALVAHEIPVIVRIDPVIPTLNESLAELISAVSALGVKHITSSTYKVKADNWMRLKTALPQTAEALEPLYFKEGETQAGSRLLPKQYRIKLLSKIRQLAIKRGMQFGVCREGLSELNTAACDGSWLLPKAKEPHVWFSKE
jgi:DNA repair photolyase